ncbi:peptidylprolyl isomerase [bacterium]|nr:peptidylprolyl isomerase [bacterium]
MVIKNSASLLVLFFSILLCDSLWASTNYDSIKIFVNDHVITKNEIEIRVLQIAQLQKVSFESNDMIEKIRSDVIDTLLEEVLLDIRADDLKILISDEDLDEELERFREQRKINKTEFEELLEQRQISLTSFRNNYRRQMSRREVVNREVRFGIEVDEKKLKEIYESETEPETLVRARHILLRLKAGASEHEKEEVRKKIMILKEKIQTGEPFQKIADEFSEDPSVKNNHGDLGFFRKEEMVAEFSKVAFSLDPGRISDPVQTSFGLHLIEVVEKKRTPRESFENEKNKLFQEEYQKLFSMKYKNYLEDLKKKAKIIHR